MIKLIIEKKGEDIVKVECSGHSGYASAGEDIICSAISAITQTALLALLDLSNERVAYQRKDGYLCFECPTPISREQGIKQQAILRAMYLGIEDIQKGHSECIRMEVK